VPIDLTSRYVAYCDLIAWGADSVARIEWLDGAGNALGTSQGNTIAGVAIESPLARPDRLDHYTRSGVFADPPANARFARMSVVLGGTWLAGTTKAVFGIRPFLGEIAPGVQVYPPWDPGGSNVVGTLALARGAAGEVLETPLSAGVGTFNNPVSISLSSDGGVDWSGYDAVVTVSATCAAQADGSGSEVALYADIQRVGGNPIDNPFQYSPQRPVLFVPVSSGTNTYRGHVEFSHRFVLPKLVRNFGEGPQRYVFVFRVLGTATTPAWAVSNAYMRVKIEKR
jgi:hypothetical protein